MSETPRTDALIKGEPWRDPNRWVTALDSLTDLSRDLERELNSALATNEHLLSMLSDIRSVLVKGGSE